MGNRVISLAEVQFLLKIITTEKLTPLISPWMAQTWSPFPFVLGIEGLVLLRPWNQVIAGCTWGSGHKEALFLHSSAFISWVFLLFLGRKYYWVNHDTFHTTPMSVSSNNVQRKMLFQKKFWSWTRLQDWDSFFLFPCAPLSLNKMHNFTWHHSEEGRIYLWMALFALDS